MFAILSLFLNELVINILNRFFKNKKAELPESQISNENLEKISEQQDTIINSKLSEDKIPHKKIEQIREQQQSLITNQKQTKIDIAIHYTQKEFAFYTSDKDLKLLYDYVIMYAEKLDFDNIKPIKVKYLSNLDLYHFGWNRSEEHTS